MRKILVIARRDYQAMVATKAFLMTICLMPVLMMGGMLAPKILEGRVDVSDQRIVVLDQSGKLYEDLEQAAHLRNDTQTTDPKSGRQIDSKFLLERGPDRPVDDPLKLELSSQIRDGKLFAFVDIPPDVLEESGSPITFHSENPAFATARRWVERTVTGVIQGRRLAEHGIDPALVRQSSAVRFDSSGLFEMGDDGLITQEAAREEMAAIFLPMGIMMFMFMIILMSAQPMLESVLEEKSMRIAEVLLGSVSPTQLMAGKLIGNVCGSLTVIAIYATGAAAVGRYQDLSTYVPWDLLPWLIFYQLLAVLMFSSVFLSIGAAVNHIKEAQGMLLPVWMFIAAPLMVWFYIIREPNGQFATVMSLIPPFTPMLMSLRMAVTASVPVWQPVLGAVLLVLSTVVCIFAAGRVFRIGLLSQGTAPKLTDLVRWAITG